MPSFSTSIFSFEFLFSDLNSLVGCSDDDDKLDWFSFDSFNGFFVSFFLEFVGSGDDRNDEIGDGDASFDLNKIYFDKLGIQILKFTTKNLPLKMK